MKRKERILKNDALQSIIASVFCIVVGLLLGFLVLLIINPGGAAEGIAAIVKNFLNYSTGAAARKYLGNTLVKTAPLLMCALSICFCYKVGLFNIGTAGQYCVGIGACLYAALAWKMPWIICMLVAVLVSALWGAIVGLLKAYRNVNEVISGIMLNWIGLYLVNMLLTNVKESTSPYTLTLSSTNKAAIMPTLGLHKLFSNNQYVTIAVPLSILLAILLWILLTKTRFGYELRATGYNKEAAKYAGMNEKRNIVLTLMIGAALAGLGASFLYLTGYEQWQCSTSSVPGMGFNGIAATFLGGLSPIGTIFSSFFIQHITSGGAYLDKSVYPSQISDLISAIIIYLCGFVGFFKLAMNRRITTNEEKALRIAEEKKNAQAEENTQGGEEA